MLPHDCGFSKGKLSYKVCIKSVYCSICDDYGVNENKTWMNGDRFYTTRYGVFGDEGKITERSLPDNLTLWIVTHSKGLTRKRSVWACIYLIPTTQVQARSSPQ